METIIRTIRRLEGQTRRQAEQETVRNCLTSLGCSYTMAHRPDGSPYLVGVEGLEISVSHSKILAAVLVFRSCEGMFGIDVEDADRKQLARVTPRILNEVELAAAELIDDGFAKAWTAKEAVFKAARQPAVDFARDIRLEGPDFRRATFVPQGWSFDLTYSYPGDRQLCCIASKCNNLQENTL